MTFECEEIEEILGGHGHIIGLSLNSCGVHDISQSVKTYHSISWHITTYHNIFPNNLLLSLIVFSKALPNSAQPTGWPSQSQAAASSAVASSSQRQLVRLWSVGFHIKISGSDYYELGPRYYESYIYVGLRTPNRWLHKFGTKNQRPHGPMKPILRFIAP